MIKNLFRAIKLAYLRLLRVNDSPHKIAMGFALGAFIGVFPTFWLGGVLSILFCWIFRLNYVSAVLGAFIIMNPLTTPLFWTLSAIAGGLIFSTRSELILEALKSGEIFHRVKDLALVYMAGNMVVSSLVSALSYWLVKRIVIEHRNIRAGKIHGR